MTANIIMIAAALLFSGIRVAFVGDTQVDNPKELSYARRSIYKELRERKDLDLVVFLGDLVNDKTELLSQTKATLDSMATPWVSVNGNHDKDIYRNEKGKITAARDCSTFSRIINAPDTTFMAGGVRFILMDDVKIEGMASYRGGLRNDQWTWLSDVIASTGKEPVIFCSHIPVWEFSKTASDSLKAVLGPVRDRISFVCGHTHTVHRMRVDGIDILDAGATCGTWWRGVPDENGIPYAIMNCGAPRGYFVADIKPRKGIARLRFKAIGKSADFQASAFFKEDGALRINVFGGSPNGVLELKVGSRWYTIDRMEEMAPELYRIKEFNRNMSREYRKAHRDEVIPVLSHPSPHVWGAAAGLISPDCKRVKIRYNDRVMSINASLTPQKI